MSQKEWHNFISFIFYISSISTEVIFPFVVYTVPWIVNTVLLLKVRTLILTKHKTQSESITTLAY